MIFNSSFCGLTEPVKGVHHSVVVLMSLCTMYQDHLQSRMEDFKGEGPKASKMLVKLFPTKIHLQQPQVTLIFFMMINFLGIHFLILHFKSCTRGLQILYEPVHAIASWRKYVNFVDGNRQILSCVL